MLSMNAKVLSSIAEAIEKDMSFGRRASSKYSVYRCDDLSRMEDVYKLDRHLKGFRKPNRLGKKNLKALWDRDHHSFYVVYDSSIKKAVGYCDVFGLDPKYNFLEKN